MNMEVVWNFLSPQGTDFGLKVLGAIAAWTVPPWSAASTSILAPGKAGTAQAAPHTTPWRCSTSAQAASLRSNDQLALAALVDGKG